MGQQPFLIKKKKSLYQGFIELFSQKTEEWDEKIKIKKIFEFLIYFFCCFYFFFPHRQLITKEQTQKETQMPHFLFPVVIIIERIKNK